jgi:hypothetical protein
MAYPFRYSGSMVHLQSTRLTIRRGPAALLARPEAQIMGPQPQPHSCPASAGGPAEPCCRVLLLCSTTTLKQSALQQLPTAAALQAAAAAAAAAGAGCAARGTPGCAAHAAPAPTSLPAARAAPAPSPAAAAAAESARQHLFNCRVLGSGHERRPEVGAGAGGAAAGRRQDCSRYRMLDATAAGCHSVTCTMQGAGCVAAGRSNAPAGCWGYGG